MDQKLLKDDPETDEPNSMATIGNSEIMDANQEKLMSGLFPKGDKVVKNSENGRSVSSVGEEGKNSKPRGPSRCFSGHRDETPQCENTRRPNLRRPQESLQPITSDTEAWKCGVIDRWYEGLAAYQDQFNKITTVSRQPSKNKDKDRVIYRNTRPTNNKIDYQSNTIKITNTCPNIHVNNIAMGNRICDSAKQSMTNTNKIIPPIISADQIKFVKKKTNKKVYTKEFTDVKKGNQKLYRVKENLSDTEESDTSLREIEVVGRKCIVPSLASINPRNIRHMTISKTPNIDLSETHQSSDVNRTACNTAALKENDIFVVGNNISKDNILKKTEHCLGTIPPDDTPANSEKFSEESQVKEISSKNNIIVSNCPTINNTYLEMETGMMKHSSDNDDIELVDVASKDTERNDSESFFQYCADQQKLFETLGSTHVNKDFVQSFNNNQSGNSQHLDTEKMCIEMDNFDTPVRGFELTKTKVDKKSPHVEENNNEKSEGTHIEEVILSNKEEQEKVSSDQYVLTELANNAYVFLTLPKCLHVPLHDKDQRSSQQLLEVQNNSNAKSDSPEGKAVGKKVTSKKKKRKSLGPGGDTKKKDALNKNALKVLLFENLKRDVSVKSETSVADKEVGNL